MRYPVALLGLASALAYLLVLGPGGGGTHAAPTGARARAAPGALRPLTPSGALRPGVAALRPGEASRPARLRYRWLVRTRGAPPAVAVENRARGTSAWRLSGPARLLGGAARGPVEGYVAKQAIAAGETESVYVDAPGARAVTLQVYRIGWYAGAGGRLVLASGSLPAVRQPPCTHRFATGLTECRWRATLSFPIPRALPSGVYIVKLQASDGAQRDCLFVVRARRAAPLLVEIPTASYEAYNAWGGDSLYPGGSRLVGVTGGTQGVEVSYDRPYDSQTGAGQFFVREVAVVRFLERYGYRASYTTSDSIDRDPGQVEGVRALMDVGHSEYWSGRAERTFARARDRGASLLFISSDTMAWRVRYAPASGASSQAGEPDHRIVSYKEYAARDPDRAEPSGLFPFGGANLVGSAYDGCITQRLAQSGSPVYRYYAWTPSPALQPAWLFAHSGITAATRIPGIVGYELDQRTSASPPGTRVLGAGLSVPCMAEREPSPTYGNVAQTTLYPARSGALVFSTGTLGWEYALSPVPQASPDAPAAPDPRIVAITRKLLAHVLERRR
jgi:N,N-dimethylformamidase beta subunit-like, C-terminal